MSYIVPFQNVSLFEATFKHQINKKTGKVDERKFVFRKKFGKDLPVEPDRYRLIWMAGCPHSNKAVLTLRLLGLDRVISVGECGVLRDPRGWVFSKDLGEVDPVLKIHYLDDAYLKGDPEFTGRSTVPAIVDIETGKVVQNEAWEIPKYLITDWKAYHKENAPDLYPEDLRSEIDSTSEYLKGVNAYSCGFARSQEAYDEGYASYFKILDELEEHLATRRFLHGDFITLSDIHLYVALIRFHVNYHLVFGVNKKRLEDYPNLWGYTRDLYQTEAFYEYTKLEDIKLHYQLSPHMRAKLGNVYGLLGVGPDERELLKPTGREALSKHTEKFLYQKEHRALYQHKTVETELQYLEKDLLEPIAKAAKATFQTDLDRWAWQIRDVFEAVDRRLGTADYLVGNTLSDADRLLYKTLLRFDYIYYYIYKLNFAKTFDYENIRRYEVRLKDQVDVDIQKEKEEAFRQLDEDRNPYHLVFGGPEELV